MAASKEVPTPRNTCTIDTLAIALEQAVATEHEAKTNRQAIEKQIAQFCGFDRTPFTFHGDDYEIETVAVIERDLDPVKLSAASSLMEPENFAKVFSFRPRFDEAAYLDLKRTDPDDYKNAALAIRVVDSYPSINVKRRES